MVSSAVNMELQELLDTLERFRRDYRDNPEYQALRAALPADWPL
ncbi:MAG TPA: hypothetical protein VK066_09195 [Chloroflexota bacterium]|nr:hypothetical protein [Chloroflexota bacterium]